MSKDTDIILISIAITISITSVIIALISSLKKGKYDELSRKIEMEQVRSSIERELYKINDRLLSTNDRWKDVNHLLLRKEQDVAEGIGNKGFLNNFLKSNGLTESDLDIEDNLIFVLTPFNEIYERDFNLIREVCQSVGLKCIRGDETYFNSDIFSHVLKNIVKSKLIIANVNGRNANVLYELGIAQALDKPTILMARTTFDIPIDLRSKRFIIYENDKDFQNQLKNELIKSLSTRIN